nr:hypothetical protein CFP56_79106 [Quercus suber]
MAESSTICHRSTTHHPPLPSLPPLDQTTNLVTQSPKLNTDLGNRSGRHRSPAHSTPPPNPPNLAAAVLHPL